MKHHQNKIVGEALTYDDVLLVPAYSKILPKDVEIKSKPAAVAKKWNSK